LNFEFIDHHQLTCIDNLETGGKGKYNRLDDPDHPDHFKPYVQDYIRQFGVPKVEANALVVRPEEGRELCRQAILRYLPDAAVENYDERLRDAREELKDAIAQRMARS
jgi:hypothetical protein